MKIGIFGGSFNPVHNGHIHLAESVLNELSLDKVIFVPSKISPHKSSDEYVSEKDRFEMLSLAVSDNEKFEVSDYELKQERISYTIYTIEYFRNKYPEDTLYLLVGTDMLLCFDKWKNFKEIMNNAVIAAISRDSGDYDKLVEKKKELSSYGKIEICHASPLPVSSTEIRKKIRKSENLACYLNENVVQYIRLGELYI